MAASSVVSMLPTVFLICSRGTRNTCIRSHFSLTQYPLAVLSHTATTGVLSVTFVRPLIPHDLALLLLHLVLLPCSLCSSHTSLRAFALTLFTWNTLLQIVRLTFTSFSFYSDIIASLRTSLTTLPELYTTNICILISL